MFWKVVDVIFIAWLCYFMFGVARNFLDEKEGQDWANKTISHYEATKKVDQSLSLNCDEDNGVKNSTAFTEGCLTAEKDYYKELNGDYEGDDEGSDEPMDVEQEEDCRSCRTPDYLK